MSATNISDYNELFLKTAHDHIAEIEKLLEKYSQTPETPELPKEIFRHAHSLKGSALVMGHTIIGNLCDQIDGIIHSDTDIYRLTPEIALSISQKIDEIKENLSSIT